MGIYAEYLFECRDSSKDEMLVSRIIRIAGLIQVQQMHGMSL